MAKPSTRPDGNEIEARLHHLLQQQNLGDAIEQVGQIGQYQWDFVRDRLESCSEEYARIFGMTMEEVVAAHDSWEKTLAQIHPADRTAYAKTSEQLKINRSLDTVFRIILDDGSIRHIREMAVLIVENGGKITGCCGLMQDITEQKVLEQNLRGARGALESIVVDRTRELADTVKRLRREMSEREKVSIELESRNAELERFAYTVSHDLKTPLVTIKGFVGLLGKDIATGDWDRVTDDLERISSATDTMGALLSELLELSRIGRVIGSPVNCNLSEIAEKAVEMAEIQVEQRRIKIEIDENMPTVFGDETRLLEVFLNLVENAVKFMGDQKSPRIKIGATENNGTICCHVQDNGIGIDSEYSELIFGLFERLNLNIEGTGVGLTLVKRIVEVHDGEIWVESEGPGLGSKFLFTLPKP